VARAVRRPHLPRPGHRQPPDHVLHHSGQGIDFTKLRFVRETFRINSHPQVLDKFPTPPKTYAINVIVHVV
jgi:hypothetical protein